MEWLKTSDGRDKEQTISGLSTDTKPTITFNGIDLNGNTFFIEKDTGDLYYYITTTNSWVVFGTL